MSESEDRLAPKVRVLSPALGDHLLGGQNLTLRWHSDDNHAVASHRVQLSLDGGKTYRDLGPPLPGEAQACTVYLPDTACESARVRVLAQDAAGNLGMGLSGVFIIAPADRVAPKIKLLFPCGGEVLPGGESLLVKWESHDDDGLAGHQVQLSLDGGVSWNALVRDLPAKSQAVECHLPKLATTRARVRVLCRDESGNQAQDHSAEDFTITYPLDAEPNW